MADVQVRVSIMDRRTFISGGLALVAATHPALAARKQAAPTYQGAELVELLTPESPGTVIVNTHEKALYHIIGGDAAMRYGVAVGKAGFDLGRHC